MLWAEGYRPRALSVSISSSSSGRDNDKGPQGLQGPWAASRGATTSHSNPSLVSELALLAWQGFPARSCMSWQQHTRVSIALQGNPFDEEAPGGSDDFDMEMESELEPPRAAAKANAQLKTVMNTIKVGCPVLQPLQPARHGPQHSTCTTCKQSATQQCWVFSMPACLV